MNISYHFFASLSSMCKTKSVARIKNLNFVDGVLWAEIDYGEGKYKKIFFSEDGVKDNINESWEQLLKNKIEDIKGKL